jgi:CRP-like cAMP-binding protein
MLKNAMLMLKIIQRSVHIWPEVGCPGRVEYELLLASIITQSRVRARARLKQSQAMGRVPAFSNLDAATIESVIDQMSYMRVHEGAVLCRQGDVADRFFVCITGECEVLVGDKKVGMIRSLDYFGEGCFVPGEDVAHRSATTVN